VCVLAEVGRMAEVGIPESPGLKVRSYRRCPLPCSVRSQRARLSKFPRFGFVDAPAFQFQFHSQVAKPKVAPKSLKGPAPFRFPWPFNTHARLIC